MRLAATQYDRASDRRKEEAEAGTGSYARSHHAAVAARREPVSPPQPQLASSRSRGSSPLAAASGPAAVDAHHHVRHASLRDEIAERRERLHELQSQLDGVLTANQRLADEMIAGQSLNTDLQSQIAAAAAERTAAEGRLASARAEAAALEDEARALEQAIGSLRQQLAAAEEEEEAQDRRAAAAAADLRAQLSRMHAEGEAREAGVEAEIHAAERRLGAAQREAAVLRESLAEHEEVARQVSEAKAALAASKGSSLHKQLVAVTRDLAASEARFAAQLADLEAEREELSRQLAADSAERDALMRDLAAAVAAKQAAGAALVAARRDATLESLEAEADRARASGLGVSEAEVEEAVAGAAAAGAMAYAPGYTPFEPSSAVGRAATSPQRQRTLDGRGQSSGQPSQRAPSHLHGVPSELKLMVLQAGPDSRSAGSGGGGGAASSMMHSASLLRDISGAGGAMSADASHAAAAATAVSLTHACSLPPRSDPLPPAAGALGGSDSPTDRLQRLLDSLQMDGGGARAPGRPAAAFYATPGGGTHPAPVSAHAPAAAAASAPDGPAAGLLRSRIAELHQTAAALQALTAARPQPGPSAQGAVLHHAGGGSAPRHHGGRYNTPIVFSAEGGGDAELAVQLQQADALRLELGIAGSIR